MGDKGKLYVANDPSGPPPDCRPNIIPMKAREAVKGLTLTVKLTGLKRYRLRVAIGGFFIALGTAIMGIRLEVKRD